MVNIIFNDLCRQYYICKYALLYYLQFFQRVLDYKDQCLLYFEQLFIYNQMFVRSFYTQNQGMQVELFPEEIIQDQYQETIYDPRKQFKRLSQKLSINISNQLCSQGNQLFWCCTTETCPGKNSLYCGASSCNSCFQHHTNCITNVRLSYITSKLTKIVEKRKELMVEVYRKEEEMIRKIREMRETQIQNLCFPSIQQDVDRTVRKIFGNVNQNNIKSSEISKLCDSLKYFQETRTDQIQKIKTFSVITVENILDKLKQSKRYIFNNNQNQKANKSEENTAAKNNLQIQLENIQLFKFLSSQSQSQSEDDYGNDSVIEKSSSIRKETKKRKQDNKYIRINNSKAKFVKNINYQRKSKEIDNKSSFKLNLFKNHKTLQNSSILTIEKQQRLKFIYDMLKCSKSFLLFKASEHKFSPIQFHSYCDDHTNTLVLIKTNYGKTIGGFTPEKWKAPDRDRRCTVKQSSQSFIFSLDMKQKFNVIQPEKAIYCCRQYGPTFGAGPDIFLASYTNCSSARFSSYSTNRHSVYDQKQLLTSFVGSPKSQFHVVEYEVYKIIRE